MKWHTHFVLWKLWHLEKSSNEWACEKVKRFEWIYKKNMQSDCNSRMCAVDLKELTFSQWRQRKCHSVQHTHGNVRICAVCLTLTCVFHALCSANATWPSFSISTLFCYKLVSLLFVCLPVWLTDCISSLFLMAVFFCARSRVHQCAHLLWPTAHTNFDWLSVHIKFKNIIAVSLWAFGSSPR